jgi:hypothetical protein
MVLMVLGARALLPDGEETSTMTLRLVVMVTVGVLSYAAMGLGVHGDRLRAFRSVLAMVRS